MSIDVPAVLAAQSAPAAVQHRSAGSDLAEIALTVLFAAASVLFVSFIAVVTGLI